ncbi:MAG: single-stranded DNA-binding protein [Oligoflexales bacterium]
MASLNRVTLVGNLGQDPELRYTQNQIPVVNFSLATTETRTDAQGQRQEQTEWHRVIVWNKQAENVHKFLKKGRPVLIEGKIQYRKWQDKNGQDRYTTDIVAQRVLFLGGGQGQHQGYGESAQATMAQNPFASHNNGNFPQNSPTQSGNSGSVPSLDDIPF